MEDPGKYLYKPKPVDDSLVWMLLVNTWMFREPWKVATGVSGWIMKKGSDENEKMRVIWRGLKKKRVWKEYYRTAVKRDVEKLRGLLEVLHWA